MSNPDTIEIVMIAIMIDNVAAVPQYSYPSYFPAQKWPFGMRQ